MSPYFVSFLGLVGVVIVAWLYLRRRKVLVAGVRVSGTVTGVVQEKPKSSEAGPITYLEIEFRDPDGNDHRIRRRRSVQIRRLGWDKGTTVELAYPPGKPDAAIYVSRFASQPYLWGFVLALVTFIIPLLDR